MIERYKRGGGYMNTTIKEEPRKKNVFYGMRMNVFSVDTPTPAGTQTNTPTGTNTITIVNSNNIALGNDNDMNAIKKKYERQSRDIQPFIHTMKKGIVERANVKTGECGSCGRR
jgi:hypothetical protein